MLDPGRDASIQVSSNKSRSSPGLPSPPSAFGDDNRTEYTDVNAGFNILLFSVFIDTPALRPTLNI